jgi:hypothetical protein
VLAEASAAISRPIRQKTVSNRNTRKQQLHEEKAILTQPISSLSKKELESFLQTKTGRRLYAVTPPAQTNQLASNCTQFLNSVSLQLRAKIQARLFENVNIHEFSIRAVDPVEDEIILEPKLAAHRKSVPKWESHDIQMFARGNMVHLQFDKPNLLLRFN